MKHNDENKPKITFVKSLRYTIWMYFVLFIFIVIVLMWFFQLVALPVTYQNMKIRDIKRVGKLISTQIAEENYKELFDKAAYDNNMCIKITDYFGNDFYSIDILAGSGAISSKNDATMQTYRDLIMSSENGIIQVVVKNERFNTTTLLYGRLIGTKEDPIGFLFLNTSLDPLNSTISILQRHLFIITIVLLILGLILSFFMAKHISRPIDKITKSAKSLAEGDYNVHFDGTGYYESEKLASALNFASTEISKVDNLRRDLMANISHDLRTPLTMVKAYAEMIRDLSGDNPQKREEHLNIIIDESDRLSALVNDILDLSKIESGNSALNITEFEIGEKLDEILQRYTLFKEQKGYTFTLIKDEPVTVKADEIKIEQVLYNLINNAINYSGDSREITIRQINSKKSVRIEISDKGDGISPDLLPLIFDRYYRAEKSGRDIIGTGLGLSIVKSILKKHSFPFGVQSELGKGSTFWFEIVL
ncbi:MAG: ATP-binding protein [Oscillospiraceae bacterium]